ncbi:hypothetical protein GCM10009846_03720 [Agrococcus versicolor]|uniref:DUF2599 domain-containing protein n=1 Tax=Agrococcus versicolor TaxID=501482 RepID=A0ABN3AL58_9MICO
MRSFVKVNGILLLALVATVTSTVSAHAEESSDEAIAIGSAVAVGVIDPASVAVADITDGQVEEADVRLTVPDTTSDPFTLEDSLGTSVALTVGEDLPPAAILPLADAAGGVLDSGAAIAETEPGVSTIPMAHDDGGLQVVSIIESPSAATRFEYGLTVPEGVSITINELGAIQAVTSDGTFVAAVLPAWAVGAAGRAVPTHYELTPGGFAQVVAHDDSFQFPIAADPYRGIDLINYWAWGGNAIAVHVTPWMGAVGEAVAITNGWNELTSRVFAQNYYSGTLLSRPTYRQQWVCHAVGKSVIGFLGFLGLDQRPAWTLEGYRRTISSPGLMVSSRCNW